jgi:hypothetical protein
MHGVADRLHGVVANAPVVARQQHAPFGERNEQRVVHLELHRQFDPTAVDVVSHRLDAGGERMQQAASAADSNRAALKFVGRLTCSTLTGSPVDETPADRDCKASRSPDRTDPTRSDP